MTTTPAPTPALATARLRLDPLRVEDADRMETVLADPALYGFTGGDAPTLEALRSRYVRQVVGGPPDGSERWHNWILRVPTEEDVAVGFVQATVTNGGAQAETAWVVGVPWQGRGYASEAARAIVEWLRSTGATDITARIRPDHVASASVAERSGFVPTNEVVAGERVWRQAAPEGTSRARSSGGAGRPAGND